MPQDALTASPTSEPSGYRPADYLPFPALVRRVPWRETALLTPLDTASPGDIVAMTALYLGYYEETDGVERRLEGFYVMGDEGPRFAWYDELPPERDHGLAARLAVEHLYTGCGVDDDVTTYNLVPDTTNYACFAVTFVDMRCLFDSEMFKDPEFLHDQLEDDPEVTPCLIEVFGDGTDAEILVRVEHRLEIIRRLLLGKMPRPGFCKPHF